MTTSISSPLSSQGSMKSISPSWRPLFPCNSPIPHFKFKSMCFTPQVTSPANFFKVRSSIQPSLPRRMAAPQVRLRLKSSHLHHLFKLASARLQPPSSSSSLQLLILLKSWRNTSSGISPSRPFSHSNSTIRRYDLFWQVSTSFHFL
jgi:hypothetical protein